VSVAIAESRSRRDLDVSQLQGNVAPTPSPCHASRPRPDGDTQRVTAGGHVQHVHDRGRDADPAAVTGLQHRQAGVEPEQPAGIRGVLVAIKAQLPMRG
jgi:hypothetical protein